LALTHDLFEKQRSHGATAQRGVHTSYAIRREKSNTCSTPATLRSPRVRRALRSAPR